MAPIAPRINPVADPDILLGVGQSL